MKSEREIAIRLDNYKKNLIIAEKMRLEHAERGIRRAIEELRWILERN